MSKLYQAKCVKCVETAQKGIAKQRKVKQKGTKAVSRHHICIKQAPTLVYPALTKHKN